MEIGGISVDNLVGSSNTAALTSLIPGLVGASQSWLPDGLDTYKNLTIILPNVGGLPPNQYTIMEVKINSTGELGDTIIVVYDMSNQVVYNVSCKC